MQNFGNLISEFRANKPVAGSPEMIGAIAKIVSSYLNVGDIVLPIDDRQRYCIIESVLNARKIRELFESENWEALDRNPYLYGLDHALAAS